mgnify:CR=1 FL=1
MSSKFPLELCSSDGMRRWIWFAQILWKRWDMVSVHFLFLALNLCNSDADSQIYDTIRTWNVTGPINPCLRICFMLCFLVSTAKLWNNLSCNCSLLIGPPVAKTRYQLTTRNEYWHTRLARFWNLQPEEAINLRVASKLVVLCQYRNLASAKKGLEIMLHNKLKPISLFDIPVSLPVLLPASLTPQDRTGHWRASKFGQCFS